MLTLVRIVPARAPRTAANAASPARPDSAARTTADIPILRQPSKC